MNKIIDDAFLFEHVPQAEKLMMDTIPSEKELSHKFTRHFKKKMKKLIKDERRSPLTKHLIRYTKNAAAITLLIIALGLGLVISVDAYRIRLFDIFSIIFKEFSSIKISSEQNADNDILIPKESLYIPKGFIIAERTESKYSQTIIYKNNLDEEIYYMQRLLSQEEQIVDTENVSPYSLAIKDQILNVIENKGATQIYWNDSQNYYLIMGKVEKTELLKMIESILD